jgi:hypothetical protein
MILHQGKGLGYAVNTDEELDFVSQFAVETGNHAGSGLFGEGSSLVCHSHCSQ